MLKQPNMKLIGIFIIIGIVALICLFSYFLKSKFSNNETTVVMYFDESVKGLDVGAPVLFKGVKIGEVSSVRLKANLKTMKFLIPVYAKIYNGKSLVTDNTNERERFKQFIQDGLRAQLAINSVITGQLLIELDMYPNTPVVLHEDDEDQYEIPTINSPFAEISKSLQVMPITQIVQDIHGITQSIDQELPELLKHMNTTLATINNILLENRNKTSKMVTEVSSAAQSFDAILGENAAQLTAMIESFAAAAASLRNLTDYLQMNPSSLITGKDY